MCSVEAKRPQSTCAQMYSTPTASAAAAASRSDAAAERHLMVAVGFSPRITEGRDSRRVATLEFARPSAIRLSGVATRRAYLSRPNRGLKPTATINPSLCDENPGGRTHPQLQRCQSLERYSLDTLPSRVLAREYRLALLDEKRQAKELKARKATERRYAS